MEMQLSAWKRKLTVYCKKLEDKTAEVRQQRQSANGSAEGTCQGALATMQLYVGKVEEIQHGYAGALDKLGAALTPAERTDYEQYIAMAEATLVAALDTIGEAQ
ncbi:unnamed protein product, partial [Nippostrongylus brasiliensis]|uniref:Tubulin-specific chaperone A n=1 Tax=Nippostrongylus brasiliensis TaxID=27835 RepID=A0A0N4XNV4_NIPBR